jgi:hypothetical protein
MQENAPAKKTYWSLPPTRVLVGWAPKKVATSLVVPLVAAQRLSWERRRGCIGWIADVDVDAVRAVHARPEACTGRAEVLAGIIGHADARARITVGTDDGAEGLRGGEISALHHPRELTSPG